MFTVTVTTPNRDIFNKIADILTTTPEAKKPETVVSEVKEKITEPKAEEKQKVPAFLGKKEEAAAAKKDAIGEKELFEKVKEATTALVKINREIAVATLAQFGAKGSMSLKPEHYVDYIRSATVILENHKKNDDLV